MDQYQDIREMYLKEGMSQRAIARELNISRNTVRRYCLGQNMPWERKPVDRPASVITPDIKEFITSCLEEDTSSPRKQRHTSKRIYDRLCDEKGFTGGASTVRQAVREIREKMPKVFVPLEFDPGEAIQIDWGSWEPMKHLTSITANPTAETSPAPPEISNKPRPPSVGTKKTSPRP